MADDNAWAVPHFGCGQIFVFCLGKQVAAKTVPHGIVGPRIDARSFRDFPDPLGKKVDVLLGADPSCFSLVRRQPFDEIG